jgi:hypothetical protein
MAIEPNYVAKTLAKELKKLLVGVREYARHSLLNEPAFKH